jgi:hypothetical protein
VVGANILREEIEKPAWLAVLDAGGTFVYEDSLTTTTTVEKLK